MIGSRVHQTDIRLLNMVIPFCSMDTSGGRIEVRQSPSTIFRPIRFIVDPLCAPYFDILSIRIGNECYLDGPIAATLFPPLPRKKDKDDRLRAAQELYLNKISFPTCLPSQQIIVVAYGNKYRGKSSKRPFSAIFQGITTNG